MIYRLFALIGCLLLTSNTAQAETSLFFNDQDLQKIESLVDENPKFNARRRDDIITLDAIFYYGADNWTIWLNGKKWTPDSEASLLQIIDVTPKSVTLKARPLLGSQTETIKLSPNQSYDRVTGEIL